jgi:anti-sigma factor RsiW
MSLCESIDTLSMAYVDDELAAEERRELEAHLTECAACRAHVDSERADHSLITRALAAPPAPDMLRARIARSLDAEDKVLVREQRRRWSQYLLPGSSIIAAAAAIAVFVGVKPLEKSEGKIAMPAMRLAARAMPASVQMMPSAPAALDIAAGGPPHCSSSNMVQLASQQGVINDHDATMYSYRVDTGRGAFGLSQLVIKDVADDELDGRDEAQIGGHVFHIIHDAQGHAAVTYVDTQHHGYMFFAPELSENDLLSLVASCIGP